MVYAAYLRLHDGSYIYGDPHQEDADTLAEFLEDAAGGLTITPAPEIVAQVINLRGGTVFSVTDPSAAPGHEVAYLVAWDGDPAEAHD